MMSRLVIYLRSKIKLLLRTNMLLGIPPPIVSAANSSLENAVVGAQEHKDRNASRPQAQNSSNGTETIMKYMTFGLYGSSWTAPSGEAQEYEKTPDIAPRHDSNDTSPVQARTQDLQHIEPRPVDSPKKRDHLPNVSKGCFLIGLKGDLENEGETDDEDNAVETGTNRDRDVEFRSLNNRILLRTLHIERKRSAAESVNDDFGDCMPS